MFNYQLTELLHCARSFKTQILWKSKQWNSFTYILHTFWQSLSYFFYNFNRFSFITISMYFSFFFCFLFDTFSFHPTNHSQRVRPASTASVHRPSEPRHHRDDSPAAMMSSRHNWWHKHDACCHWAVGLNHPCQHRVLNWKRCKHSHSANRYHRWADKRADDSFHRRCHRLQCCHHHPTPHRAHFQTLAYVMSSCATKPAATTRSDIMAMQTHTYDSNIPYRSWADTSPSPADCTYADTWAFVGSLPIPRHCPHSAAYHSSANASSCSSGAAGCDGLRRGCHQRCCCHHLLDVLAMWHICHDMPHKVSADNTHRSSGRDSVCSRPWRITRWKRNRGILLELSWNLFKIILNYLCYYMPGIVLFCHDTL